MSFASAGIFDGELAQATKQRIDVTLSSVNIVLKHQGIFIPESVIQVERIQLKNGQPVFVQRSGVQRPRSDHSLVFQGTIKTLKHSDSTVVNRYKMPKLFQSALTPMTWELLASVGNIHQYSLFTAADLAGYEENHPPYEPVNPNPSDGATNVPVDVTLSWECNDPDPGDTLTYDVYFGTSTPLTQVAQDIADTFFNVGTLDIDTMYLWQIVARDSYMAETTGPMWRFTTGGAGPTPTVPPSCDSYFVTIDMPGEYFCPGDTCYLNVQICNPDDQRYIPLFIILEIQGEYWFAPTWGQSLDYYFEPLTNGISHKIIVDEFVWPDFDSEAQGYFYAALTNPEINDVLGDYDFVTFGFGPCR